MNVQLDHTGKGAILLTHGSGKDERDRRFHPEPRNNRRACCCAGSIGPERKIRFCKHTQVQLGRMADEMAKSVNRNVEASMEGVRTMVRDFVAEIIRKEAPEVSEAQLKEICDIYVPKPGKHNRNSKKGNITSSQFPPEALIQMVEQFVSYSTGSMSAGEQVHLNEIMPGWQEKYFRAFPAEVQKLLRSYLKGETDAETCFEGIYNELGL